MSDEGVSHQIALPTANASNQGPIVASSFECPSNECLTLMADNAPDEIQPTKKARTLNDQDKGEDKGPLQNACSMDGLSDLSQDFFPAVGEDPENFHSIAAG